MNKQYVLRKVDILKNYSKPGTEQEPTVNTVHIKRDNSLEHEREKFNIAWRHVKAGCDVITEAQTRNDETIDIVCLDCNEEIKIVKADNNPEEYKKNGRRIIAL